MKHLFGIILFVLIFHFTEAKTIRVPQDHKKIQAAINAARNGDTVLVAPGTYYENINFRGKRIVVTSQYFLNNDPSFVHKTIINGSKPVHADTASCVLIVSGEDSTAVLQGFTLTGGTGTAWKDEHSNGVFVEGGGIHIALSSPTIQNNIIRDNAAIRKPQGILASGGGGIRSGDGKARILNNVIMGNSAMYGGGIVSNHGSPTIKNNLIVYNRVFLAADGTPTFGGGGIWLNGEGETCVIENNTIYGNMSSGPGNPSGGRAGGIQVQQTKPLIRNNIVWGNVQSVGGQINFCHYVPEFAVDTTQLEITHNNIHGGLPGPGNIDRWPFFDDGAFTLGPRSTSIDAGSADARYNDPEDPAKKGSALFPSKNTTRGDMGCYGGNYSPVFGKFNIPRRLDQ